MALPAGITTCTVTLGKALGSLFDDATLSGTVQVDRRLVWTATGDTIYPVASSVVASQSGGWLSFVAAHVDQAGFVDQSGNSITNFSYTFNGRATFSDGSVVPIVKNFQVFVGQSTIDLDLLPDGPATLPVVAPNTSVYSVAGLTGPVTLAQLQGLGLGGSSGAAALARTSVKTAATYTAAVSDLVPVDTTSNSVTVTLPNAPTDKAQVAVKLIIAGTAKTLTVACAGADTFNRTSGATSMTLTLLGQGALYQYDSSTKVWTVAEYAPPLSQLDARFYAKPGTGIPATDLATAVQTSLGKADAANAYADSKDSYQRLISYYGKDESGLPNKPWRQADPIGPDLWQVANFTNGGAGSSPSATGTYGGTANTSTTSMSATQVNANTANTTRILIPDQGESNYTGRFRFTTDISATAIFAWELRIFPRDESGALTTPSFTTVVSYDDFSIAPNARRIQTEINVDLVANNRTRYFDVVLFVAGSGSPSGTVSTTNTSLRHIGFVLPYIRAQFDRPLPDVNASFKVQMPLGEDVNGVLRWVRETFGPDNGQFLLQSGAVSFLDTSLQSPRRVDGSSFGQYPVANMHVNNSADVITVYKSDGSYELRGNTHGGETGQSGTFTTDNVVHVDYGDGTWVPVTTYDRVWHYCRRVRVVVNTKLTRSDQPGAPFANITRTYICYNDGTIRCDKTVTWLTQQKLSKWFWHMTSQNVPGGQYEGKLGRGQQVLGKLDYATKLVPPTPTAPSISTTGGSIPASVTSTPWSVRVTALNQFGETTSQPIYAPVTTTGSTSTITVNWGAVTGASYYGIYFGLPGNETRVAVVTGTSYTITGNEQPTGIGLPEINTAVTGGGAQVDLCHSQADWSAIREKTTGVVMSLSLDRNSLPGTAYGVTGIEPQIVSGIGITKNYWPLTFNNPTPTIPVGAVFTGRHFMFFYLPNSSTDYEREQTFRAASVADLPATLYPSA